MLPSFRACWYRCPAAVRGMLGPFSAGG